MGFTDKEGNGAGEEEVGLRSRSFPGAQTVKRLPIMWETQVQFLGRKDLLEKQMETHSSILAWKIPWMEEPGKPQFMGSQRVRYD